MLRRARVTATGLAFGSTVGLGLLAGAACSVNQAGLSTDGGSVSAMHAGGAGGVAGSTGGVGSTGVAGSTGGVGSTGAGAMGGVGATQGAGATGAAGAAGGIGAAGSDGVAGAGVGDTGGGAAGAGGNGQTGGRGGGDHVPDCSSFPAGSSFITPTDGLLHCYWVHPELLDWNSSESTCEDQQGTLATILSGEENVFVLGLLASSGVFPPATTFPPSSVSVSLGATDGEPSEDAAGPGTYSWVTNEPWGYTNWHATQPDGSCNSCESMNPRCGCDHWLAMAADGTWYDRPEAAGRAFICEAPAR